ncbi:MAG: flagellar filament capping protein FliD [Acetatifactor sp.]
MAMRLSGLMSGMDTDSVIQELVSARRTKVDTAKKAQTKLSWKQDTWKELNTKLKNLQSKYLSNMRFTTSYSKKTTKVSNSAAVSVITGEDAVNGVQTLKVKQLAKTGYLTGAELKGADGKTKGEYTALTKLSDLGVAGEGTFSVKSASGSVDVKVNGDTTISDVLTKLKEAGLNASFDAKNQRFFISAKDSGVKNDFSLTASDANGASALSALGLQVNLNSDKASLAQYREYAGYYVAGDRVATIANMQSFIDKDVESRTNGYLAQYKSLKSSLKNAEEKIVELEKKYEDSPLDTIENYENRIKEIQQNLDNNVYVEGEEKETAEKKLAELKVQKADAEALKAQKETVDSLEKQIADISGADGYIRVTATTDAEGNETYTAAATAKLTAEVEDAYYNKASYAATVMSSYDENDTTATGATKVTGQDAVIVLNDAEFTNNTNVFEVNGLTFTALSETAANETVTVTTQNDTDGIYDMIKNFLKEYNTIINEMDKLYNADSAKGFEPLTNDEKEAMSESEVEEYEKKIKDSLLRRDENLSSISSALKTAMAGSVTINGKKMYLSDFGINTLSYFSAPDNQKNAYHIDGDADDADTSGNADVLKGMIASDPDTVITFFSRLSQQLYTEMSNQSKSVDGYRSFGSFYDDKKMKTDYTDYNSKIADLEEKLNDYEDKWYKKFAAMETAMAKLQSSTSAITGLLGGN